MKKRAVLMLVILGVMIMPSLAAEPETPAPWTWWGGTFLDVSVNAASHWVKTYPWTLDESVSPELLEMKVGEEGSATYTVTVTRKDGSEEAWVDGQVCVTNRGNTATKGLAIAVELRRWEGWFGEPIADLSVDVSANPVLGPGERGCYPYRINLPLFEGRERRNREREIYRVTVHATIDNHWGRRDAFGPSKSVLLRFPRRQVQVHPSATVADTNGKSWLFSEDGQESYQRIFKCSTGQWSTTTTATMTYDDDGTTGPSDTVEVTVICENPGCSSNAVVNGGFEEQPDLLPGWTTGFDHSDEDTSYAVATDENVMEGSYALRLGRWDTEYTEENYGLEPGGYDWIYQDVKVPMTETPTLTFSYNVLTWDLAFDSYDIFIKNLDGDILATVVHDTEPPSSTRYGELIDTTWIPVSFPLAAYRGQTIRLWFEVFQDGYGDQTAMFIDQVSICQ